ncbi:MAG: AraC family transcriptional regulator [Pseudomonadota bacterium]
MDGWTLFEIVTSSVGGCAGLFFALALLVRDRTASAEARYLALAVTLVGLTMVEDALAAADVYDAAPWAFGFGYATLAWLGPLVWLHVAAVADPVNAGWRRAWPHVGGAVGLTLLLAPWLLGPGDLRWRFDQGADLEGSAAFLAGVSLLLFVAAAAIQLGSYLLASRSRASAVVDRNKRRWLLRLTAAALVGWAAYLAGLVGAVAGLDDRAVSLVNLVLALAIYALAMLAIAAPPDPLTAPPRAGDLGVKYARSALDEADIDRLMEKLAQAIRRGLHTDPTLTLQKLAAAVQASANDVSQALNMRAGGFHEWLSRARIEEATARMARGEDAGGLLDLALAVGFNSKSTFYEAFRRVTGQTPAAWRSRSKVAA